MQSEESPTIVSTDQASFIQRVESAVKRNEPLIVLLRFSHQGGNRAYFIVKSMEEWNEVLSIAHPRDALSVFFSQSFPIQGEITSELTQRTMGYLDEVLRNGEEAIFVIRLDTNEILLGMEDMKPFNKPQQVEKWFSERAGIPVMVGLLAFWEDDSDAQVTAYVRDSDGEIRRGAY